MRDPNDYRYKVDKKGTYQALIILLVDAVLIAYLFYYYRQNYYVQLPPDKARVHIEIDATISK